MKEQPVYNRSIRGGGNGTNIISNIFGNNNNNSSSSLDGTVGSAGIQQQYYSNINNSNNNNINKSSFISLQSTSRISSIFYQSQLYRIIYPYITIISSRFSQINNKFGRGRLALFIQIIALALLLNHTLDKFQMTDDADARLVTLRNNLCMMNQQQQIQQQQYDLYHLPAFVSNSDIPSNIDLSTLCKPLPNQYSKFIWIFIDSLARDQALDIISQFQDNASVYRIMNHGFKFSTAIYTSFFTGKIPTNYAGRVIKSDNIFHQMKRANLQIKYMGPDFPTLGLLGDSISDKLYFDEYEIIPDETNILSTLFGEQSLTPSESSVSINLDELTYNGKKSVMLTSNLLDDKIHRKGKYDTYTLKLLGDLSRNIPLLKKWLSEHPDYLFIFNSDHGGSNTGGQHEGELHGKKDGGNEGFIMFSNPSIKPLQLDELQWLDTVDVAPTLVRYFKNVNIPLESLGKAAIPDLEQPNYRAQYLDLLTNALQIRQLCRLKGFPYSESDFERASSLGTNIDNLNDSELHDQIKLLSKFIISVKEPMVDFKKFPGRYLLIIGILMISLQLINLKYEPNLISDLKSYIIPTVLLFFFLYIDFLFLKFDYHDTFTNIFNFYLMITALSIIFTISTFIKDIKFQTIQLPQQQQTKQEQEQIQQQQQKQYDQESYYQQQQQQQPYQQPQQEQQIYNQQNNNNEIIIDTGFSEIDIQLVQNQHQPQPQQQQLPQPQQEQQQYQPLNQIYSNQSIMDTKSSQMLLSEESEVCDSLNNLSNNIFYVMFAMLISNVLSQYLSMVYEPFQAFLPLVNLCLSIFMVYTLFRRRMQQNSTTKVIFISASGYCAVIALSFLYEFTGIVPLMQLGYIILLLQFTQLMLFNRLAEDGYLITSILYYVVASDQQRFYLLTLLVPPFYLLTGTNLMSMPLRNQLAKPLSRMTAFLLLAITFNSYLLMGGEFNMNVDTRAGNVGLVNMEDYPTFSGFLMLYHKLGFFFILSTFLLRLSRGDQSCCEHWNSNSTGNNSAITNRSTTGEDTSFKYWIFRYLGLKAIIMMWIFNLNFYIYKDYLECFIMTMIISIVVIFYGVLLLTDDYCKTLQPRFGLFIIKMKQSLPR